MGGGASLMEGVEELMSTAILIGRAISAVTFPGMYRLYDFHSKRAPKLKNAQKILPLFGADSDDEEEQAQEPTPDPAEYEHFFKVKVGEDIIYIEEPLDVNEAGWTPLHACCMSLQTVDAGLLLIDEMIRLGGGFEAKTHLGPGTFNKGWTALQMACAYGVEPLVEKLVESKANVNVTNSFGYSCMLEACHRGYIVVAKHLLKGGVDLSYIPKEEDAMNSPFASAPCQSALAEAARCGFFKVVQTLLEAGAPKDLANRLGWTALHEACFYNRMETVKTLLLAGCDPTLRTKQGALPYHLACIPDIRTMLENMGGSAAVPTAGDKIDMLQILTELTSSPMEAHLVVIGADDGDDEEEFHRQLEKFAIMGGAEEDDRASRDKKELGIQSDRIEDVTGKDDTKATDPSGSRTFPSVKFEPSNQGRSKETGSEAKGISPAKQGVIKTSGGITQEEAEGGGVAQELLHSGPLLGNLPALNKPGAGRSPSKHMQFDVDAPSHNYAHPSSLFGQGRGVVNPSARADDKRQDVRKKGTKADIPKDMPVAFLCQLTQRPMSDPVKTMYGNVFDRTAIVNWLSTQGKICPLTGAPLSENDLIPCEELSTEIKKWILLRSTTAANETGKLASSQVREDKVAGNSTTPSGSQNDDLYDF